MTAFVLRRHHLKVSFRCAGVVLVIRGNTDSAQHATDYSNSDNAVGWLGTVGVLEALRRRAVEGGSYRVTVSLTRTVFWLLSMGIFDKAYAQETAGSTDEHTNVAPDLFTAKTPSGSYQDMTDQVVLHRTPGAFRTVLVPRGSSKLEWLVS
jgi:crotonobetainyl-CoA:carnitine CoA-transferase CaiB-like acyl-CoA transferase